MDRLIHFEDIESNHRPRALDPLHAHLVDQGPEPRLIPFDHRARAEEAQDPGRRQEGAEHDGDPPVFVEVADGLAPGAGSIDVGGVVRIEDGKGRRGETFGGDVDVFAGQRRRGCEEYLLFQCLEDSKVSCCV